jgi:hypothetical protein
MLAVSMTVVSLNPSSKWIVVGTCCMSMFIVELLHTQLLLVVHIQKCVDCCWCIVGVLPSSWPRPVHQGPSKAAGVDCALRTAEWRSS